MVFVVVLLVNFGFKKRKKWIDEMNIIDFIKTKKAIHEYVEDIIFSIGGNNKDVKRVMKKIKENGYVTVEEVDSFLEDIYI